MLPSFFLSLYSGRWGDSTSPAFGELSDLSHFYSFTLGCDDDRRAMLGHCPLNESDVYEVFARYVEGTVPHIPWVSLSSLLIIVLMTSAQILKIFFVPV